VKDSDRGEAALLKTTKGAGAKFWCRFPYEKRRTNRSQQAHNKKVQSSPGERRNLGGGHGEALSLLKHSQGDVWTRFPWK